MAYLSDVWKKVKKPLTYVLATAALLAAGYGSCQGIKALTGGKGRETTLENKVARDKALFDLFKQHKENSEDFVLYLIRNLETFKDSLKKYNFIKPETVRVEIPAAYLVPYSTPTPGPTPDPWRGQDFEPDPREPAIDF